MKKVNISKKIIFTLLSLCLIVFITVSSYAVSAIISAKNKIEINTLSLDASSSYSYSSLDEKLSFKSSDDTKSVNTTITNNSLAILHYYFQISTTQALSDNGIEKAILVYYDNKLVASLFEIIENNIIIQGDYSFVRQGGATANNVISFKLHEATSESLYHNKTLPITITAYCENANYSSYLYVSNEEEFKNAIDDVNNELYSNHIEAISEENIVDGTLINVPTIVLLNNISLTTSELTLTSPCKIELNGYSLTDGSIMLNSTNAILDITNCKDNNTLSTSITLSSYDTTNASTLLINRAKKNLSKGLIDSLSLLDNISFYNPSVSTMSSTNYSYSNNVLTRNDVATTLVDAILVNSTNIEFKVIGNEDNIASSYLTHIPNDENKVVTTDLFLPKAINNKNIEISWTSSNEEIMNHDGIIVASYADRELISLYATIRINETIITKSFTFMVSAHSNEINFYRLVNEISPLVIYKVYSDNKDEAYYYLPLVDENSAYDYRKNYNTPSVAENVSEKYVWNAHREIELVSLTYSEVIAENDEKPYNYLSLDESENNAIYLNKDTLNTYGEINVTGTFITGEVYSSVIKVILSVGTNTSILEPAFAHVNQQLADVDILYNMLDTRINKGMANESANFKLPSSFNDEFTLTYGVGSSGVITNISSLNADGTYTIEIDPTKFSSSESSVAIEATITYSSISQTKTFYFKVPAILTVEEFGNITNFNSIKYQVYQQLPANEKTGNSGFEISGNNIINHTPSYILLRDVIGDESYISEGYSDGNYRTLLRVNHQGCKDLFLATPEKSSVSSNTDAIAYDFISLINWATSRSKRAASSVINVSSNLSTSSLSLSSDGKEYLSENEVAVLKEYYMNATGKSESEWNDIWNQVAEKAPGYIINDAENLNKAVVNNVMGSWDSTAYFKYFEVLQWATNEKDDHASGAVLEGATFNLGIIGNYDWVVSTTYTNELSINETVSVGTNSATRTITYSYSFTNGSEYWYRKTNMSYSGSISSNRSKYNTTTYKINSVTGCSLSDIKTITNGSYLEDETDYISPSEAEVLKVFWLNYYYSNLSKGQAYINAFNSCTIQPTYFTSNGIATLINNFYEATSLNEASNFTSSSVSTVKRNNFKTNGEANMAIKDFAYDIAPAIYNLDSITTGLNYFKHLENLYIYGNESLSMFLSNGTLSSIFTRMTLNNTKIQTLIMEYCANNYVTFDIENTKNLTNLVNVDFSNNFGINNVSKLVNSKRANYQYVDISNLSSIDYEFAEFAITHLGKYATVFYTNEGGTTSSFIDTSSTDNEVLTNLKEFDTIIAENMFVINQDSDVYWRIESGNEIYKSQIELGGEYPTISTITEMNTLVSPYFYCSSSFEYNGTSFSANKIYKITFNGSTMNASIVCNVIETEDINNVSLSNEYLEQNGVAGSGTTYELDESTATGGYRNSINPSPGSVTFNTYQISAQYWWTTYYWTLDTNNYLSLTSTSTSAVNVSFLTVEEKDMIKNNSYTSNLLGATSLSSADYYIYFPEKGVFLGEITSKNNSSITTVSASEAAAYTYSGGTLKNNGYYISRSNRGSLQTSSNSTTWTFNQSNSISIYPTLTVNYSDGTSKTYEFSEFGQYAKEYTKIYKSIIEKTYTVSEMKYYSNGNCYSLDFTYNKQAQYEAALSGISIIESYYYISPTNSNKKVSLGSIDEIKSITYKQAGSSQSTTYEVSNDKNANNTMIGNAKSQADSSSSQAGQATWVEVSKTIKPYISHIKDASETNISNYKNLYDTINNLGTVPYTYLYTGSSKNEIVYKGTATGTNTSYTSNYLYNLSINASKLLTWSSSGSYASSTTMDALLETANSHFNDKQYGEYYGMYYAYSGSTMYTISGNLYEHNYVYRIMPNESNTAFVFVKYKPYEVEDSIDNILKQIFEGTLNKNHVGNIYYLNMTTGDNRTYHNGFYTLSYNVDTGSYYLKTFCDVDYEMMSSSIITLSNERILSSYLDRYGTGYEAYYGGTGNTLTVVISVVVRNDDGSEEVRKFKVDIVG